MPLFTDVLEARRRVRPYLDPTPLRHHPGLTALTGAETWVKHENFQPTGAFKVRGGINLVSQLSDEDRRRGLISASTGNHGQSIAFSARLFGVSAGLRTLARMFGRALRIAGPITFVPFTCVGGSDRSERHC